MEEIVKKREQALWKQELIKNEKERLIKEHIAELEGFMPKGLLQTQEDAKYMSGTAHLKNTNFSQNFKI